MYQEIHHSLQLADPNQPLQNHTVKLCTCNKCHKHLTDICFYVPFCIIFVCLGIIQIISGIFYFITTPVIKLILNIAIGCWAILCGISGSMVACVCPSKPRKHEYLLYCSLSILMLNIINLILLEFGQVREIFNDHIQKMWSKEFDLMESENGRFITTYSAVLSIIVAFIETQINFCFLSHSQTKYKKEIFTRKPRCDQNYIDNDQAADLEYVIPKKNESNGSRRPSLDTTVQVYAKSWVFEGTGEEEFRQPGDSSSASICSSTTKTLTKNPSHINPTNNHQRHTTSDTGRISKMSDAISERFIPQMSSFSRCATPSPIPNSGQITPTNVNYSDYLDATYVVNTNTFRKHKLLTVDYVPTSETSVTSVSIQKSAPKYTSKTIILNSNGPPSVASSQQDDSQYASMLAELEQSLNDKKVQVTSISPDDITSLTASTTDKYGGSSKSSSKDLEFSKELEAALQLIQDLETPSEGPADGTNPISSSSKFPRSESEKTLSAAISLPSPEQMPYNTMKSPEVQTPIQNYNNNNGKQHYRRKNVIHIEPSSQSTSGYSSPNSFSSNAQLSHVSATQNSSHSGDQANIVRIYIDPNGNGDNNGNGQTTNSHLSLAKGHILNANNLIDTIDHTNSSNVSSDSLNKSYLLLKRRSKLMPHSDFQNRIFKSECLAYLTDDELVARHKCNRDVIRKIEQNVAQKIRGSPRYSEFNA